MLLLSVEGKTKATRQAKSESQKTADFLFWEKNAALRCVSTFDSCAFSYHKAAAG